MQNKLMLLLPLTAVTSVPEVLAEILCMHCDHAKLAYFPVSSWQTFDYNAFHMLLQIVIVRYMFYSSHVALDSCFETRRFRLILLYAVCSALIVNIAF
jgi:hypothetical protein